MPRWDQSPHTAIEFAARKVAKSIFTAPQFFKPAQPKTKDVGKDISRRLSTCISHIEAIADLLDKHSYKVTKEQSKQWEELKDLIRYNNFYFEDEDENEDEEYYEDEDEDNEEDSDSKESIWDTE